MEEMVGKTTRPMTEIYILSDNSFCLWEFIEDVSQYCKNLSLFSAVKDYANQNIPAAV